MINENNLPVLIVGAGPTGLMMACELARHRIPFRIIDKKPERTLTSNATWVQTRTLEIADEIGIIDDFIRLGNICRGVNLYEKGKLFTKISFDRLESLYQFVLMLPQSDIEQILISRLAEFNVSVERARECIDILSSPHNETVSVLNLETDSVEKINCHWLIACDGANSFIRNRCNLLFQGEDLLDQCVVADAEMNSFLHSDEINVFFDKGTLFSALPLGKNKYRLGANLHLDYIRKFYTEKEVKELVIERAYGEYNVESVSWISPFWIHSKAIDTMRKGHIFFAGDAAHIHSPAGGQGMNTGLQDAYNLAWKLALVIRHEVDDSILDSYEAERLPTVKQIIKSTERFMKAALSENVIYVKLLYFFHYLMNRYSSHSSKIAMQMTQLSTRYKQSPIISYNEKPRSKNLLPGMRAPNVLLDQSRTLFSYLDTTLHNILIFCGVNPDIKEIEALKKLQKTLSALQPTLIKVHLVIHKEINVDDIIVDRDNLIHARYQQLTPALFVLRPDNYIAYYSQKLEENTITHYLSKLFKA